MIGSFAFFKFAAKAALHCAGCGIAGDLIGEAAPEVAREIYLRWVKGRPPDDVRAEVQALANLRDDDALRLAAVAIDEECGLKPEDLRLTLITYLAQIPAAVRQTQRSLADPSGRSVAPSLVLSRPADVMAFLPPRPPRFRQGQRAPGFPDWRLEELLGIGGFGEVWKAKNPHLASEPPVALKFCLDGPAARMLRNEAALLDQVRRQGRHPGIVALVDTALDGDPPCLKYEYVAGGDLTGLIRQWHDEAADVPRRARGLMGRLAEVVAFAHRLTPPIVHRDLKPANILLLRADGEIQPKIADFGIGAIESTRGTSPVTGTRASRLATALRGACTPLYASPQQARGDDPHPRDDVFALGVIWYQMLTGHLTEQPGADWREELAARRVDEPTVAVMGRCLAVREERRLPDAQALVGELRKLGRGRAAPVTVVVAPVPDGDDEVSLEDPDDPLDLAARVQRSLAKAQRTLSKALDLAEKEYDYAAAVTLLEGLPEPFRDNGLLDVYRGRQRRVKELRSRVLSDASASRFAGLQDRIQELLTLTPRDEKVRRLAAVVPWEPGAEVTNAVGMRLVLIRPGLFLMGSPAGEVGRHAGEGPAHEVDISLAFYLGVHTVTQEQYQRVAGRNPAHFRQVAGHDARTFPVENVSWEEASEFCRALSSLPEERQRGRSYRLPTEAEWEYACRAGTPTPFSRGVSLSSAEANFDGRYPCGGAAKGDHLKRTAAVGSYAPNAWGLYDMHGNVWEWCSDWYSERYYRQSPRRDPRGPDVGEARVLRGGCWQNHGRMLRAANRDWVGPGYHGFTVGFRVVLVVGEPHPEHNGFGEPRTK
jgi:formylglycine-generating enzyme required for sulfatase activity